MAGALLPWSGRAILLVDLDAFFASVETLDHPQWRGKPVIVGGDPLKRGVVSTCSYEARRYGVHSAMASATAARLCPDAIWTQGNFKRYSEVSDAVMDILLAESPLLQQVSIDEAFLDVTPGKYSNEHPVLIANRIRDNVSGLGVTCSVGLGTSKTIAKIASDMDKPNGITVVYPGSEQSFLSPLSISRMSGIGRRSVAKLGERGIRTLGDLAHSDIDICQDIFGVNAQAMRDRALGIDPSEVSVDREVKSVSNEMTFSYDLTELEEITSAIELLCGKVGRRLRRKGLSGHTVTLKVKYPDLSIRTARRPLDESTDDEHVFAPVASSLLSELWYPGIRIRLLGVAISGFDERALQMSLFDGPDDGDQKTEASRTANRKLAEATDRVRERFGDGAVRYGREIRFEESGTGTAPQNKEGYS